MRPGLEANGGILCALRRALPAIVFVAVLVPALAAAEAPADDAAPAELAPIVIDAERTEEPALVERSFETPEDVTGFGETIFAEPTWRSFETTAELLGESVGAQVRRQGGRDDFATLSIRGAPAAQLRILLDGVALGRASDSVVNLADLPSDFVERIEIYRGFSPVSLTPVSSAGVVNVITRDPERAIALASIGGGSFGSAKVNAGGAGPLLGGSASAFGSYRHTEGDYDYVRDEADQNPGDDDDISKLDNNDSDAVESLLRWKRNVTDRSRIQLRNHVFYKEEGVPDFIEDSRTRLETVREIAAASLGSTTGRWNAEQIVTWEQKDLSDTRFEALDNTSDTTASTTVARWTQPLGESNWISGSADYTWEGFDQSFDSSAAGAEADRHSLAAAVGDDWTIAPLRTTISMQLRHQRVWNSTNVSLADDGTDQSTDPRIGLKWEPLGGVAIKGNASTYFRPPNFDELYGTDGFTRGNPALVPETGLAWDAGLEWSAERAPYGRIAAGYAWFGSNVDDIIVVEPNFDRETRARNVSEAEIRGHELRMDWKGPAGIGLSANYTYQNAKDRSGRPFVDGLDLPGIPPHEGWARASWTHDRLVVAYELEITGSHFQDSEHQRDKIPTRTIHSVQVACGPFWKGTRLTLEGHNLGNSLVPDEVGYPLPGRSFYATLSWSSPREEDAANAM